MICENSRICSLSALVLALMVRFSGASTRDGCRLGQCLSSLVSQSGPFHQSEEDINVSANTPREAKSAGFTAVGTCFQSLLGRVSCICETLFATKVFHVLGS